MDDVAIVGIGIHPFGRHDSTGLEQGAFAVRQALGDAGIEWNDVQFAFGGSAAAGGADTMVSQLGLTGLPFINVANGCATGGVRAHLGLQHDPLGRRRRRDGDRLRQAPAGRLRPGSGRRSASASGTATPASC